MMYNSDQYKRLYPELEPFRSGFLKVSDPHKIYFEEAGNPKGKPVVFVHGGPGGATNPKQRRVFDPSFYRIILFDQRGCGRSTPHASLIDNTTWHLVDDMESLRRHLGIDKWQVFGGSWGSTLALAYAQSNPTRVAELILRGIFLLREKEISWFYQYGASELFPDAWQQYLRPIPPSEQHDLLRAYHNRLTGSNRRAQLEAAKAWSIWEKSTSSLVPDKEEIAKAEKADFSLAFARIECHYFVNRGFFEPESQLLDNVGSIRHIPCVIVQGRYDVVCPMTTAWALKERWPEADFRLVQVAGHSQSEPGITHELVSATNRFRVTT